MKQLNLTPELHRYIIDVSLREDKILQELRHRTEEIALSPMQISPEQGQFMQLLLRSLKAKKVLEVGTFTGYSALAMALALPEDGQLITCDINEEWTTIAQTFWQKAKQNHKIILKMGRATDTLHQLIEQDYQHFFDFIFIDADKTNYVTYYEQALQLVSAHGLIAIDNVLWGGKVIETEETGGQTREIRRLNAIIKNDPRVECSLLPIADGLFLIQPKPHVNN